jgi:hypothetical protein
MASAGALAVAFGRLAIDHQADPLLEGESGDVRRSVWKQSRPRMSPSRTGSRFALFPCRGRRDRGRSGESSEWR